MKKLIAFFLALTLLVGTVSALTPSNSKAMPSWATEAYDHLEGLDFSIRTQDPTQDSTRSYFVQMLVKTVELAVSQEALDKLQRVSDDYFDDRNDTLTLSAATYGIVEGKLEGDQRLFDVSGSLTRQEAAKMVCSTLDFLARYGYVFVPDGESAVYADEAAIAPWAAPYTSRIAAYGLMLGDENGNFMPADSLNRASAIVLVSRLVRLVASAAREALPASPIASALDWSEADDFTAFDGFAAKPMTGYVQGYFTAVDSNGQFTGVVVGKSAISVERYDETGAVVFSRELPMELPIFGAFLAGEDCYYIAFGQKNEDEDDSVETYRIVKYDSDWNRVGSVSANGGESNTTIPYRSTVSRMALSEDGKTLALHAARQRYASSDGLRHQSNITFLVDTDTMTFRSGLSPNHVSHSFGQFVRFDGSAVVTVDHGDAYPRAFVLRREGDSRVLMKIYGDKGANVTNAIGSGFEVSDNGYLFLGCSDPQTGEEGPWNLFLTYTDHDLNDTTFTWLTDSDTTINRARLVKVDGDSFVAMWDDGGQLHLQTLDGQGNKVGAERVYPLTPMPSTQPVVYDGHICWL